MEVSSELQFDLSIQIWEAIEHEWTRAPSWKEADAISEFLHQRCMSEAKSEPRYLRSAPKCRKKSILSFKFVHIFFIWSKSTLIPSSSTENAQQTNILHGQDITRVDSNVKVNTNSSWIVTIQLVVPLVSIKFIYAQIDVCIERVNSHHPQLLNGFVEFFLRYTNNYSEIIRCNLAVTFTKNWAYSRSLHIKSLNHVRSFWDW